MTSSRNPTPSKPRPIWRRPERILPALVFLVLLVHGSWIGLTDDEAYYWVLAQQLDWAYAFHPPAVAWLIAVVERTFGGWFGGFATEGLVRLPAAFCAAAIVALGADWMKEAGALPERLHRGVLALLSFAGLFSLAWMMVPDLPLFLGLTLAFVASWRICHDPDATPGRAYFLAGAGVALALLSKYSGVLVAGSAGLAILIWAPRARRWKGVLAVFLGGLAGALPSLIWNAQHDWGSLLYQLHGRHEGGALSLVRFGRFWAVELALAGPVLLGFCIWILRRAFRRRFRDEVAARVIRYAAVWILPPALLYGVQPLWADFKPHWAFVAWWPAALVLGWAWSSERAGRIAPWARAQVIYGLVLGGVVLLSCHVPIGNWVIGKFARPGTELNPKLDVTNDLYGWRGFPEFIVSRLGTEGLTLPVIGGRYQTASQTAFALRGRSRVTLIPRDLKARDEWPELGVSEHYGPEWPRLRSPVLFVTDIRYDAPPGFPGARCERVGRHEARRGPYLAKWIDLWRCEPT